MNQQGGGRSIGAGFSRQDKGSMPLLDLDLKIWPQAIAPGAPMWFDFGMEGDIEKILEETGFSDIKTSKFTISIEVASSEEYWDAVVGISGRLQMPLKNIPYDAAERIKNTVMAAAENFRSGDSIRIPCEEIIAIART